MALSASPSLAEGVEAFLQVRDQVVGRFQPDVQPNERSGEVRRRGSNGQLGVLTGGQTLVAAPGKTQTEQFKGVEHRLRGTCVATVEHNAEQTGCACEVSPPEGVVRGGGKGWPEHLEHLWATLKPLGDTASVDLVLGHPGRQGA